jgi:hypothetical protein
LKQRQTQLLQGVRPDGTPFGHLNFFQHECYLEVRTARVKLPAGRVVQIEPDWFGKLSGFTLLARSNETAGFHA